MTTLSDGDEKNSDEKKPTSLEEETPVERVFNQYVGNAIHIFLSVLALFILCAAAVGGL